MGTVKGNWLMPSHSGRACRHENIYTKMNKKTGKCYSVKLCNPNDNWTANQNAQRGNFGAVSMALSAWLNTNKVATATDHAAYMTVKAMFDRQSKYSTVRGYMMAKGMAAKQTDGSVKITIGTYTTTVTGSTVGTGGTATSNKKTLTLSVSPANSGTVTGAGQYDPGATANITATAAAGYTFSKWSDDNTNATRSVTVNDNMSLVAQFTATGGGDNEGGGYA